MTNRTIRWSRREEEKIERKEKGRKCVPEFKSKITCDRNKCNDSGEPAMFDFVKSKSKPLFSTYGRSLEFSQILLQGQSLCSL